MKIILSNHFRRRYRQRIGYLSDTSAKQKIRTKLQEIDQHCTTPIKFKLDNYYIVAAKISKKTWKVITITKGR